jgi:hypothetical protein
MIVTTDDSRVLDCVMGIFGLHNGTYMTRYAIRRTHLSRMATLRSGLVAWYLPGLRIAE